MGVCTQVGLGSFRVCVFVRHGCMSMCFHVHIGACTMMCVCMMMCCAVGVYGDVGGNIIRAPPHQHVVGSIHSVFFHLFVPVRTMFGLPFCQAL